MKSSHLPLSPDLFFSFSFLVQFLSLLSSFSLTPLLFLRHNITDPLTLLFLSPARRLCAVGAVLQPPNEKQRLFTKKNIYTTELNFELSNSGKDFYRSAPGSFPNKIALTRREKTEDDVTKHTQFNHVTMMSFCHRIAKRRNQTIQLYRHENTCHFAHFKVCFSMTLYEFCCVVPSRVECA